MSIAHKHEYRFNYLLSDHWKNLRIKKLASVDAKCRRCGKQDSCNDVHHVNYRNLYDVQLMDLIVLCRVCHDQVHEFQEKNGGKFINVTDQPLEGWDNFLEFWGDIQKIPEFGRLMRELRIAGLLGKISEETQTAVSEGKQPKPGKTPTTLVKIKLSSREFNSFEATAARKGLTLNDWIRHLLRTNH